MTDTLKIKAKSNYQIFEIDKNKIELDDRFQV